MRIWTIKSYIKDSGKDVIREWLNDLPTEAKVEIQRRFRYLETQTNWGKPDFKKLKGYHHIYEMRITWQRNRYRPLGFFIPNSHEFVLLIGAVEKGSKFEPLHAPETAEVRRKQVLEGKNDARIYFL